MLKLSGRAAVLGLVALGFSSLSAAAAPPSTGLGEEWPNTPDISTSPHYHVYEFARDGIRYIQINDLNGTVEAAVATSQGTTLILPIGRGAGQVNQLNMARTSAVTATNRSSTTETVYRDSAMTIMATPQSNGTTQVSIAVECSDPTRCSG
jgi:hypothetical protein